MEQNLKSFVVGFSAVEERVDQSVNRLRSPPIVKSDHDQYFDTDLLVALVRLGVDEVEVFRKLKAAEICELDDLTETVFESIKMGNRSELFNHPPPSFLSTFYEQMSEVDTAVQSLRSKNLISSFNTLESEQRRKDNVCETIVRQRERKKSRVYERIIRCLLSRFSMKSSISKKINHWFTLGQEEKFSDLILEWFEEEEKNNSSKVSFKEEMGKEQKICILQHHLQKIIKQAREQTKIHHKEIENMQSAFDLERKRWFQEILFREKEIKNELTKAKLKLKQRKEKRKGWRR
eukprot:g340.t1